MPHYLFPFECIDKIQSLSHNLPYFLSGLFVKVQKISQLSGYTKTGKGLHLGEGQQFSHTLTQSITLEINSILTFFISDCVCHKHLNCKYIELFQYVQNTIGRLDAFPMWSPPGSEGEYPLTIILSRVTSFLSWSTSIFNLSFSVRSSMLITGIFCLL